MPPGRVPVESGGSWLPPRRGSSPTHHGEVAIHRVGSEFVLTETNCSDRSRKRVEVKATGQLVETQIYSLRLSREISKLEIGRFYGGFPPSIQSIKLAADTKREKQIGALRGLYPQSPASVRKRFEPFPWKTICQE